MRKLWVVPLALVAALVAGVVVINDFRGVVDVFALADPTGSSGAYFHLGGLAANLAVIFVALCMLANRRTDFRLGYATVVFAPPLLEAIAALPCFVAARPGALCGVFALLIAELAVPIVLGAAAAFIATSRRRAVKLMGLVAAVAFIGGAATAQALLAPGSAEECRKYPEVTRRSTCLNAFAMRGNDEALCRSIEFRSTRFICLREVAIAKREVRLCEEIGDAAAVAAYEAPASFYRDACYQNLAYALHDPGPCAKVEKPELRASCQHALR